MKRYSCLVLLFIIICAKLFAQNNDLLLAKQYSNNGETDKALEIYQKLYKQNNDAYYSFYLSGLLTAKKFDEAESITKKIMRQNPKAQKYAISLGSIYAQKGDTTKANEVYNGLLKALPNDQTEVAMLATLFYQNNKYNVYC